MTDPFEEFEFKPLTEGLGFHKKADKLKSDIKSSMAAASITATRSSIFSENEFATPATPLGARSNETSRAASQSISDLMASLPPSLDFLDDKQDLTRAMMGPTTAPVSAARPQIFQPLAREEYKSTLATGPTVGSVLPTPGTRAGATFGAAAAPTMGGATYRDRMTDGFAKAFPVDTPRNQKAKLVNGDGLVPVATNFSAGLIDAMVVAGVSTILLVCIITITHINLVALLSNAATDGLTQKNLVFLFFAVLQMYMLIARAFFGASLGEWAFDLQLGTNEQQHKVYYPILALWRMSFVTFTGIFAMPLLSFAVGRDLSRYVSGLQLYRRI